MFGSAGGPNSSLNFENEQRLVDAARNGSALPGPGPGRLEWPTGGFIRKLFQKGVGPFFWDAEVPLHLLFLSTRNRAESDWSCTPEMLTAISNDRQRWRWPAPRRWRVWSAMGAQFYR